MARDPFSWAEQYGQNQAAAAAQERGNAQNGLMRIFATEAQRQQPWSDLPVDLARDNNRYDRMLGNTMAKQGMQADYKAPKDALAFGANVAGRLSKDLGLGVGAASGVMGNISSETGDFKYMQEINPVVPGSRGGAGWSMWTGPRRVDFEQFTGGDTTSPEANYKYLVHDLEQNYPQVLAKLRATDNPIEASRIFHDEYLAPGVPHSRRSALRATQIYSTFNQNEGKRVVGDTEYDRRQARKAAMEGNSGNKAFGTDIKLKFDDVNKEAG